MANKKVICGESSSSELKKTSTNIRKKVESVKRNDSEYMSKSKEERCSEHLNKHKKTHKANLSTRNTLMKLLKKRRAEKYMCFSVQRLTMLVREISKEFNVQRRWKKEAVQALALPHRHVC